MFYKVVQEQKVPGSAFLEHLENKFLKLFRSATTIVAPLWVRCMYRSAQKNSGYVTVTAFEKRSILDI